MRVRITSTSSTPSILDGQDFNGPYTEILDGKPLCMAKQVAGRLQHFIDNKYLTWTVEIIKDSGAVLWVSEKPSYQAAERAVKQFSKSSQSKTIGE